MVRCKFYSENVEKNDFEKKLQKMVECNDMKDNREKVLQQKG